MMPGSSVDVAIIGGSIAGASLATVMARAGFGVIVVEREAAFRDKVRGEGIHPWGYAEALRLGLGDLFTAAGAQQLPQWQRYACRAPLEPFDWADVSIDGLPELGVSHPRLQESALRAAAEAGARVIRPARVTTLRMGERPEIEIVPDDGEPLTIAARVVIGADGRHSSVRRWIGGEALIDPEHHRFGGTLIRSAAISDGAAHEVRFPGGRSFVLPQGNNVARAYAVLDRDAGAEVLADRSGTALMALLASEMPAGLLADAEIAGPVAFFSNADIVSSVIARGPVALIGDAAGANDPSIGHGISLVFRDVREVSERLRASADWTASLADYARERRRYHEVVRHQAIWVAMLVTEIGAEADARRERVALAREQDPTAGGFELIYALGPDGVLPDEQARRRFFGEAA